MLVLILFDGRGLVSECFDLSVEFRPSGHEHLESFLD
jgi:hypothetical protein